MSRVAVIGAGWAGLAAAVRAVELGHQVTLYEMAHQPGGRARSDETAKGQLDNGQHILIGAYTETLQLMRHVGVDIAEALERSALELKFPDGHGFAMTAGPPTWGFARGVIAARQWPAADRWDLLLTALRWRWSGFRCHPTWTVADLCRSLPASVNHDLIEPLCVAALNTPMHSACANTFLRVLRDAVFGGPHCADLLLPRHALNELLPAPAASWLTSRGAWLRTGHRVRQLRRLDAGWRIDEDEADAVVLAVTAREAARLCADINPEWSHAASNIKYQPIVTVWLDDAHLRWPSAMMMFRSAEDAPAQFGFSLGALGGTAGRFTWVISAAQAWVERGLHITAAQVLAQARSVFPGAYKEPAAIWHVAAERRATFACTPGLVRPKTRVAESLFAAGDYVAGPYPSTLEGAVRSGRQAVDGITE